jgi:hypothetical protein
VWQTPFRSLHGTSSIQKRREPRRSRFSSIAGSGRIGFYEVESSEIFAGVTATFPGDTFQITEGEESQEILVGVRASKWDGRASQYDMRRLAKTHDASWSDGSGSSIPDSNLDHVYALNHLKFKNVHPPRSHQC